MFLSQLKTLGRGYFTEVLLQQEIMLEGNSQSFYVFHLQCLRKTKLVRRKTAITRKSKEIKLSTEIAAIT